MIVNKKLDRFKQWAGERMGGEVKTAVSDEFKGMEAETIMRHEGMEKMHRSTGNYVKSLSRRADGENRDKLLPIGQMGSTMVHHGDEFEHDSQFGHCLTAFGRTLERLARAQESYVEAASNTWMESLDRSLVHTKKFLSARKKLEQRRLAYDTSLAKMEKAKKEDFRVEEDLRSQKTKYEEAEEDVYRKMLEIKESEAESVSDLGSFLEAQLEFHEKCRDILLQLREEWPASGPSHSRTTRPTARSRSNTARSYLSTHSIDEEPPLQMRPAAHATRKSSARYLESPVERLSRPSFPRSTTLEDRAHPRRDISPARPEQLPRVPSDSLMIQTARSNLRVSTAVPRNDVFADDFTPDTNLPEQPRWSQGGSPATSTGSETATPATKKKPPPPPPSRATKPPPPAPPLKRTLIA